MKDFWKQFEMPYRFFSQFCDSDDWHEILKAVAGAAIEVKKRNAQLSVLDVGCGNGVATETICEMIFCKTGSLPQLTIIEPSDIARNRAESNLLRRDAGGVLHRSYKSLANIPENAKYDVIMFLHSTYYICNLKNVLEKLYRQHLYPGGKIIVLALPQTSVFFLQLGALPNCMDSIEEYMREIGMRDITAIHLRSRFRLPPNGSLTDTEWKWLGSFFRMDGKIEVNIFKERIQQELAKDGLLDFEDYLVTGKLRAQ